MHRLGAWDWPFCPVFATMCALDSFVLVDSFLVFSMCSYEKKQTQSEPSSRQKSVRSSWPSMSWLYGRHLCYTDGVELPAIDCLFPEKTGLESFTSWVQFHMKQLSCAGSILRFQEMLLHQIRTKSQSLKDSEKKKGLDFFQFSSLSSIKTFHFDHNKMFCLAVELSIIFSP